MQVRDMMHKGVEIVAPDTLVTKLAKTMREKTSELFPSAPTASSSAWSPTAISQCAPLPTERTYLS